jgi:hypothetical protein
LSCPPPGSGQVHRLSRLDPGQVGRADLGTPFQAAAADQAEQLLPRLDGRADGGAAGRDDAGVGCQDSGLGFLQRCRLQPGPGGFEARRSGIGGGLGLVQLLDAVEALVAQLARPFVAGPGFGQHGFGFGHAGAGLGVFAVHGLGRDEGQGLAARDHVADIHLDLDDAVAADFRDRSPPPARPRHCRPR